MVVHATYLSLHSNRLLSNAALGGELFDRLSTSPLSEREVQRIATQIGGAIAHCHERGVCHRDIKPENVVYTSQAGQVVRACACVVVLGYSLQVTQEKKYRFVDPTPTRNAGTIDRL